MLESKSKFSLYFEKLKFIPLILNKINRAIGFYSDPTKKLDEDGRERKIKNILNSAKKFKNVIQALDSSNLEKTKNRLHFRIMQPIIFYCEIAKFLHRVF